MYFRNAENQKVQYPVIQIVLKILLLLFSLFDIEY